MELFLTISGITLTVIFGVWGLALALRTKYPGRLTLVAEEVIPLFESIVNSVPDLTIEYRGAKVEPGLVLLKAILINDGVVDITEGMVEEPLALELPSDHRWLAATIVQTSPKLSASADVQAHATIVRTALFRRDEFLRIDLLAHVPLSKLNSEAALAKTLRRAVTVSHRIANTRRVKMEDKPTASVHATMQGLLVTAIPTLLLVGMTMWGWLSGFPSELQYQVKYADGTKRWVTATPSDHNRVHLVALDSGNKWNVLASEFFRSVEDARTARTRDAAIMAGVSAVLVVVQLALLTRMLYWRRRLRRIAERADTLNTA